MPLKMEDLSVKDRIVQAVTTTEEGLFAALMEDVHAADIAC